MFIKENKNTNSKLKSYKCSIQNSQHECCLKLSSLASIRERIVKLMNANRSKRIWSEEIASKCKIKLNLLDEIEGKK